ncbi:MAG: DinB family protein [Gemmataceae bacterium]
MYDNERAIHAFALDYLRSLIADIPDERMAEQPIAGLNHPAWTLGHLAIAYDYVGKCLGLPLELLRWHPLYAPGTIPVPDRSRYPSKQELMAKLEANAARVMPFVESADPAKLTGPQPVEFLKPHIKTVSELLSHLLTSHIANHIGQLSAWRRVAGIKTA